MVITNNFKKLALKVIRLFFNLIFLSFPWLPSRLEREFAYVQGKGFGEESTETEARFALKSLAKFNLRNPVVFDIGANIGDYTNSILSIEKSSQVYAFEPSSVARKYLQNRFSKNLQVHVVQLALGNESGRKILWSNSEASGMASLTKRNLDHQKINFNIREEVEVMTLDEWSKLNGIVPDLIKIDVEGNELEVLKGGLETVQKAKIVQFEFGSCNIDTKVFFKDLWYFISNHGFEIYRISSVRLIPILHYSEVHEFFGTTNFLAIKL